MEPHEGPVRIEISLRLASSYEAVYEALQFQAREQLQKIDQEVTSYKVSIAELAAELRESQSERMLLAFETKQAIFDRHAVERELKRVEAERRFAAAQRPVHPDHSEMESARRDLEAAGRALESKHAELQSVSQRFELEHEELEVARRQLQSAHRDAEVLSDRISGLETDINRLTFALGEQRLIFAGIMQSVSWRTTEPCRRFMRVLRAARHTIKAAWEFGLQKRRL